MAISSLIRRSEAHAQQTAVHAAVRNAGGDLPDLHPWREDEQQDGAEGDRDAAAPEPELDVAQRAFRSASFSTISGSRSPRDTPVLHGSMTSEAGHGEGGVSLRRRIE